MNLLDQAAAASPLYTLGLSANTYKADRSESSESERLSGASAEYLSFKKFRSRRVPAIITCRGILLNVFSLMSKCRKCFKVHNFGGSLQKLNLLHSRF